MGKKATKATKRFVTSGKLKKTIEARHKQQQYKKKIGAYKKKGPKGKPDVKEDGTEDEKEEEEKGKPKKSKKMTVDSFLNGDFMDESDDGEMGHEDDSEDDGDMSGDDDDLPSDDAASFASIDELDAAEEEKDHMEELSKLAEKDPEFFQFLQENDRELLNFNPDAISQDGEDDEDLDGDVGMDEDEVPVLTKEQLKSWQKALLQQRSLRALRKLLIAFRAAAHMSEDGQAVAWRIDSASVYRKLVVTSLRYTPIVLQHHIPYKTLPNGKIKALAQTPKFKTLQKLILSFFNNILHILSQLTEEEMIRLALTESAKLLPYVVTSRRTVKAYLRKCLDLWATGADGVKISAFLAVRTLAVSSGESTLDTILKSTYLTLIRSSKLTSVFTLPSINLMKNSASDVFCLDHATAYQHAFGYIRQLAILLRNSMKVKSKEAYKQVYNWQFVHCVDFWCTVLGRACDSTEESNSGKESELKPLIYPLVQVALGAIKLVPNSRSHPLHLHIVHSLISLVKHTKTYVPLAPYIIPILTPTLNAPSRPKASTLKPLDLEVHIRVPQQYVRTRVLSEGLTEEAVFLLAEWLATPSVHGSISFPEIIVPIVVQLRKSVKSSNLGPGKEPTMVKQLLDRIDESGKWVELKRKTVSFAPGRLGDVKEWERAFVSKVDESPLGKYLKVQRKTREKRRELLEKARQGRDEILDEEDSD